MTYARVGANAVLDAAQAIIDRHVTNGACFGRCAACGELWPCDARAQAANSFYRTDRLPQRRSASPVDPTGVRWSPVDWFGVGRVTTVARGAPVPHVWRLRRTAA
jgi:hypothetical protein